MNYGTGFVMVLFKLKCGIGIYCTVGCFKRWFLYIKSEDLDLGKGFIASIFLVRVG